MTKRASFLVLRILRYCRDGKFGGGDLNRGRCWWTEPRHSSRWELIDSLFPFLCQSNKSRTGSKTSAKTNKSFPRSLAISLLSPERGLHANEPPYAPQFVATILAKFS